MFFSPNSDRGSSPRMWGTPYDVILSSVEARFIPTHVGNAEINSRQLQSNSVHPHACGERWDIIAGSAPARGSSPRMWGTRYLRRNKRAARRFIPTHVGNAILELWRSCVQTVHPHACGERPYLPLKKTLNCGSSPRMWGTLDVVQKVEANNRFIPTHVGNADGLAASYAANAVHPHACGERVLKHHGKIF